MPTQRVDALQAEVRAVENGLRAFSNGDGTFRVQSVSRPGLWWTVEVGAWKSPVGWRLKMACTCEGGRSRPADALPCMHSAAVGRSLERRGLAKWAGGLWSPTEQLMKGAVA